MTLGYRVSHAGSSLVYATDNEPFEQTLPHLGHRAEAGRVFGQGLDAEFVRFIAGTHLYIGDAQYTDEEYLARIGWGHSSIGATVEVALEAQARALAFFHHDPLHDDTTVAAMEQTAQRLIAARASALQLLPPRAKARWWKSEDPGAPAPDSSARRRLVSSAICANVWTFISLE
jgi:hypothetical protein